MIRPVWSPEATVHHLALVLTRMHLAEEEKVELGLMEQGTVNPAFGVSVILIFQLALGSYRRENVQKKGRMVKYTTTYLLNSCRSSLIHWL